ncbi:methyl-accepting chemotaxis protein [Xanthobacter agilis]|uniref:Methyl-accepting chemotaxis protein n=1 Tax=Xanthobacter agilis TaxID=47492 RepID=A0ABU0LD58_XANAG|nr:methyl-accepting chemotaxis protein [Xanthobacter agilis]MDQ0505069.1 methyl-accepting chemotaxis protein [Xanthobacter agilis]
MRLADLSIRTKLVLAAGALCTLSMLVVAGVGLWVSVEAATRDAQARATALLGQYAQTIAGQMSRSITIAQTGALAVEGLLDRNMVDRDALGGVMRRMVGGNPDLVGMTLALEPNALDGKDNAFTAHPYSDATGRFVPYFFHKPDGTVDVEKLVMTKEAGTESWYDKPVRENRSLVTPPYDYPVNGKSVLMTTTSIVIRRGGQPIGIVTTDLPLTGITRFVQTLRPFGDGRVSLVGTDDLWIANDDPDLLGKPVKDATLRSLVDAVKTGGRAEAETADAAGPVSVMATAVTLPGVSERWVLVMSVPEATLFAAVADIRNKLLLTALVTLAVILALVFFGAEALARPIRRMTEKMRLLANADTSISVDNMDRKDEIGEMARAVDVFRLNAIARREHEAANARAEAERAARQARIDALIGGFRHTATTVIDEVTRAMSDLDTVSGELTGAAETSRLDAASAQQTSQRASGNVQAVAGAAEELSASISEIAQQIARTSQMVAKAADGAGIADAKVAGLAAAANGIGEAVGLIDAIAQQTNLLALNATIEAARAGEAGRGFAVVASEVKELAGQTAHATQEISQHVASIQSETTQAVEAIRTIVTLMGEVEHFATAIAGAIEEQTVATSEISANIESAAAGTGQVAEDIERLNVAVKGTSACATRVLDASRSVGSVAVRLDTEVDGFLEQVTAA